MLAWGRVLQELVPELSAAVEGAGLKWSDFTVTDNSCKPHPPTKSLVQVRHGSRVLGLREQAPLCSWCCTFSGAVLVVSTMLGALVYYLVWMLPRRCVEDGRL